MLCSVVLAEDTVAYLGGKGGQETIRRAGKIEDYSGAGLVLVTTQGRKETIPLDKLVDFQTTATDEEQSADKLKRAGKLPEAIEAYKQAKRAESRQWVIRRISRSLVDCYDVAGQIDQAGDEFLAIVAADEETPYFGSIPLAWRGSATEGPAATRAPKWLAAANQPAAELLGASWLVAGAQRAKALAKLKALSNDLDPRIAHLAAAQLWRAALVTATAADARKWQQQIERMPAELRSGPLLVLGDYYARNDRSDEALLAYLQVPLVYNRRQTLSGTGLISAARLLEKLKRPDDAGRLYREVEAQYPAFPSR
jgi:tetratricopeptide (TPR) repeat protein